MAHLGDSGNGVRHDDTRKQMRHLAPRVLLVVALAAAIAAAPIVGRPQTFRAGTALAQQTSSDIVRPLATVRDAVTDRSIVLAVLLVLFALVAVPMAIGPAAPAIVGQRWVTARRRPGRSPPVPH